MSCMQLPFKKAKYDVDIDEPGLGELYTHRLTLKAEASAFYALTQPELTRAHVYLQCVCISPMLAATKTACPLHHRPPG